MGLYQDDTIRSYVDNVNEKYFLPDIQREFVWKTDQIYTLFDSIMRGYPISTFLMWGTRKDYLKESKIRMFRFVTNNEEANEEVGSLTESEYHLVLDGQQRITSLMIALQGFYIERRKKKELYMNLLSGKTEDEDGLLFQFKFLDSKEWQLEESETEDYFTLDEVLPATKTLWLKVKALYECKGIPERRALKEKVQKLCSEKVINTAENNLETLHHYLFTERLLSFYTVEETDYDKVLDIFVRTNSGGTKLTNSDLLFSIIKLHWRDAREEFSYLLSDINGGAFDFDTDFILKTWLVLYSKTQEDVRYKRRNIDDKAKVEQLRSDWEKISRAIRITRDLLIRFGISHGKLLSSNNALIPLIYYIYKRNIAGLGDSQLNGILGSDDEQKMKKFLLNSLLTGLFSGSSDTILYSVKVVLDNNMNSFPLKEINTEMSVKNRDLNLPDEFLDSVKYKDLNSYLVLNLLYKNINFSPSSRNNLPEQDHIFSQEELKDAKIPEKLINKLYNLRYATSTSNKRKSDTPFREWVRSLSPEEKVEHMIPRGDWSVENYQKFLEERKKLIVSKVNI